MEQQALKIVTPTRPSRLVRLAVMVTLLAATPALAQTLYRYIDERGKTYYSDKPLTHLTGRPADQLSRQGTLIKRDPGAASPEQRAAAEEERRKRADVEKVQSVEQRRNLALLATYASEKEIDDAQAFALRDPVALVRETEEQLAVTDKRRTQLKSDADKLGAKNVTPQLREQLAQAGLDVKSIAAVLETKRRDVQLINDRYEEDRRRYVELARQRQAMLNNSPAVSTAAASGGVVSSTPNSATSPTSVPIAVPVVKRP